ncbi:MAG: phosphohistidine phosphatase SixA [Planctomycetaceae bacterium]|nr:phosphohistidine phosphatase SixA [Planctomycetaceae bacterium]
MLEVWIMRHGEAADPDQAASDAERPLTELGRRQVGGLARWLMARTAPPERILHSALKRARQTANLFADELQALDLLQESAVMAPGMTAQRLLQELAATADSRVLCVGHQPDIGRCVAEMIGGGRFTIAPGFCAAITFRGPIVVGAGSLQWVCDPDWFGH